MSESQGRVDFGARGGEREREKVYVCTRGGEGGLIIIITAMREVGAISCV